MRGWGISIRKYIETCLDIGLIWNDSHTELAIVPTEIDSQTGFDIQ